MSDYEKCAEVCEEHGFARQAALLRAVGEKRGRAYIVDTPHWANERLERDDAGEPGRKTTRPVFLDPEAAERFASGLSVRSLRGFVSPHVGLAHSFPYITSLSRREFCSRVGEILGRPFDLPTGYEPLIPESATDAQLLQIVPLLNLEFCTVVAVDIVP